MQSFFSEHYGLVSGIFTIGLILLTISLKSYFTEKGKLRALISENKKLVEQSETIKAKYSQQLEELKKSHELDISKRRYQYESKKEQYFKFFRLLDEFSNENNRKTQEMFLPIIDEFNRNFLNGARLGDKKKETNAATIFSKKVQKLMFDANQDLIRVKQETNAIRIIASDAIIQKLDLLELAYEKSMEDANRMMKEMTTQIVLNDQQGIKNNQNKIEVSALVINTIKMEIIELMRKEMNEI